MMVCGGKVFGMQGTCGISIRMPGTGRSCAKREEVRGADQVDQVGWFTIPLGRGRAKFFTVYALDRALNVDYTQNWSL